MEVLRDVRDVDELKIDNDDDKGNVQVRSLYQMRGQTRLKLDRREFIQIDIQTKCTGVLLQFI